ncbi:hypothetical protein [Catenovulum adriaticum]|uniref:HEAT repeat protein n=1 Tax=Catenovulum adriaticum TaxID=2984846 RepID=A0ABY7ARB5_9ALTE|nr:hypothetical protein [Catenovulum sp. TS8]WAJ71807.1 hypothetical protein OLW01_15830 [Catenovulum sp. TS8]
MTTQKHNLDNSAQLEQLQVHKQSALAESNLTQLLSKKTLRSISRRELKLALQQNPYQLIDFIKTYNSADAFETRLLLDVIFQFNDEYREQVALELLKSENNQFRIAGYRLLASANSETPDATGSKLRRVIEHSYMESSNEVLVQVFSGLASHAITEDVSEDIRQRIQAAAAPFDTDLAVESTRLLAKFESQKIIDGRIEKHLSSNSKRVVMQTLNLLYELQSVSEVTKRNLQKIADNPQFDSEIRATAKAILMQV